MALAFGDPCQRPGRSAGETPDWTPIPAVSCAAAPPRRRCASRRRTAIVGHLELHIRIRTARRFAWGVSKRPPLSGSPSAARPAAEKLKSRSSAGHVLVPIGGEDVWKHLHLAPRGTT